MTLQEAKNEVAKKYGLGKTLVTGHMSKYWEEAAELYARSKFDEACEEQKKECNHLYHHTDLESYGFDANCAHKPEFKP